MCPHSADPEGLILSLCSGVGPCSFLQLEEQWGIAERGMLRGNLGVQHTAGTIPVSLGRARVLSNECHHLQPGVRSVKG